MLLEGSVPGIRLCRDIEFDEDGNKVPRVCTAGNPMLHENAKVLFSKYLLCSFVDNEKQLLIGKIRYAAVQIRNVNQRSLFKHLH